MTSGGHHLQEERLFDCYLAVKGGESLAPPLVEHLTDCPACGDRYAELTRFMDSLSLAAAAESDAVFTPDRLRTQRQLIARKLEHLGHAARVISFPGRTAAHPAGASVQRPARRWIAAAAAAGLFVGVGTGLFFDWEAVRGARRLPAATLPAATITRQTNLTAPATRIEARPVTSQSDQAFLSELELAGERPRYRELVAVDALTPHVREINLR